jgi:hypothetical protein
MTSLRVLAFSNGLMDLLTRVSSSRDGSMEKESFSFQMDRDTKETLFATKYKEKESKLGLMANSLRASLLLIKLMAVAYFPGVMDESTLEIIRTILRTAGAK